MENPGSLKNDIIQKEYQKYYNHSFKNLFDYITSKHDNIINTGKYKIKFFINDYKYYFDNNKREIEFDVEVVLKQLKIENEDDIINNINLVLYSTAKVNFYKFNSINELKKLDKTEIHLKYDNIKILITMIIL